jgi:hypothetical protein
MIMLTHSSCTAVRGALPVVAVSTQSTVVTPDGIAADIPRTTN